MNIHFLIQIKLLEEMHMSNCNVKINFKFVSLFLVLTLLFSAVPVFAKDKNHGEQVFTNTEFQSGDYLKSQNGKYMAVFQGDGNLVVYRTSDMKPLWSTKTNNVGHGATCFFQGDSNLVIYSNVEERVTRYVEVSDWVWDWNSQTYIIVWKSKPVYTTIIVNKPIWKSKTSTTPQKSRLIMQNDSNLVIYNEAGKALWSCGICDK